MKHYFTLILLLASFSCIFGQNLTDSKKQQVLDTIAKHVTNDSLFYNDVVKIFGHNPADTLELEVGLSKKNIGYKDYGIYFYLTPSKLIDLKKYSKDRILSYIVECENSNYIWNRKHLNKLNFKEIIVNILKKKDSYDFTLKDDRLYISIIENEKPEYSFYSKKLEQNTLNKLYKFLFKISGFKSDHFDKEKISSKKFSFILEKIPLAYFIGAPIIEMKAPALPLAK